MRREGSVMNHKDLEAWKLSVNLVVKIYNITKQFPKEEMFGIVNQMRRAAISIPSNIAEGCARYSDKDTFRFIDMAFGSIAELETQLIIAEKLGYCKSFDLLTDIDKLEKLLSGLKRHLKNKI